MILLYRIFSFSSHESQEANQPITTKEQTSPTSAKTTDEQIKFSRWASWWLAH